MPQCRIAASRIARKQEPGDVAERRAAAGPFSSLRRTVTVGSAEVARAAGEVTPGAAADRAEGIPNSDNRTQKLAMVEGSSRTPSSSQLSAFSFQLTAFSDQLYCWKAKCSIRNGRWADTAGLLLDSGSMFLLCAGGIINRQSGTKNLSFVFRGLRSFLGVWGLTKSASQRVSVWLWRFPTLDAKGAPRLGHRAVGEEQPQILRRPLRRPRQDETAQGGLEDELLTSNFGGQKRKTVPLTGMSTSPSMSVG